MKKEIMRSVESYSTFVENAKGQNNVFAMYSLINKRAKFVRTIEWLQNALLKKVKRGLFPEVEYLTQCSTLKQLTGQIYKEVNFYMSANDKKDFRRLIALDILENVAEELEN